MPYKTIMVCLHGRSNADGLIEVARLLAVKNDAHAIGLHVVPALDDQLSLGPIAIPDKFYDDHNAACQRRAEELRDVFEHRLASDGLSYEWRSVSSWSSQLGGKTVEHARCVDLVIVGQGDPDGADNGQADLPEQLLMESGRPVMIVPANYKPKSVGDYALIAWNASREAARAAFDAVPLLQSSKEAITLWIDPEFATEINCDMAGSEIALSLSRYGVPVKASHAFPDHENVTEVLLRKLKDHGSDLLVMGGYGRSRLREYVFGGVTRKVLTTMPVPVFMSR